MVGAAGFEPTTSRPPDGRATRLRYAPVVTPLLQRPRPLCKREALPYIGRIGTAPETVPEKGSGPCANARPGRARRNTATPTGACSAPRATAPSPTAPNTAARRNTGKTPAKTTGGLFCWGRKRNYAALVELNRLV